MKKKYIAFVEANTKTQNLPERPKGMAAASRTTRDLKLPSRHDALDAELEKHGLAAATNQQLQKKNKKTGANGGSWLNGSIAEKQVLLRNHLQAGAAAGPHRLDVSLSVRKGGSQKRGGGLTLNA